MYKNYGFVSPGKTILPPQDLPEEIIYKIFTKKWQKRLAFSLSLGYSIAVSTQKERVLNPL